MKRLPLRWLLLGSVLSAIVVAFGGFAFYLDGVERENRLTDIDNELARAANDGPERPNNNPAPGGPPGGQQPPPPPAGQATATEVSATEVSETTEGATVAPPVQLLLADDLTLARSIGAPNPFTDAELVDIGSTTGTRTFDEPRHRIRVTEMRDGRIAITALSLDDFDAAVGRFRTALLLGAMVLVGSVAAVLWLLTGFLTRPVTRMASTARRIADGELDTPIGDASGSRETADLAVDLDRMVARMRAAMDDATASRDDMERLLADMAHEVRTPLTALKGYSDLYGKGLLQSSDDVDRAMSRIGSESQRLADLANAMLQLASDGASEGDVTAFDLTELASDVVSDLRAAYPGQRIDFEGEGPQEILGSPDRVQQALLNLGSNACHHSGDGEPIVVGVRRDGDHVVASIADHGPGISPADRHRVFLPFFRADAARERNGHGGAGLGLALTKQIVERHGGTVGITDTPGGGATFSLRLPVATGE